jgi:Aspartyl protease
MLLSPGARKSLCLSLVAVGLMHLCCGAAQNADGPQLPADVTMNPEAGRGGLLLVTCRLADGDALPMVVDTGCPMTAFDKSLAPKLGSRLDTGTVWNFGVQQEVGVYAAPKLYLGDVPLQMTGTNVVTFDRGRMADPVRLPALGILGMDVLGNYCIQLDFAAGKVRFLDSAQADKTHARVRWDESFPLIDVGDGCLAINENLAGVEGPGSMIDTGCNFGGWLRPEAWQQWTNPAAGGKIHSPDGMLGGEIYPGLDLRRLYVKLPSPGDTHTSLNGIGLHCLSENLVTLDFPNRMLYLKRTSKWPLLGKHEMAVDTAAAKSALKFLIRLHEKNQLPGDSENAYGRTTDFVFNHNDSPYLDSVTLELLKNGDPDIYHYTLTRASRHGSWKLQKAWRTDAHDRVLEEYPTP